MRSNVPVDEVQPPLNLPTRPFTITVGRQVIQIAKPLTERQWMLMNACEKEQLYGGGKRGGKTVIGAIKAIALSLTFPGNKGYILRQDLTDLKESCLETFEKICPPEIILDHNHTDRRILIRTSGVPSKIIYSGLSDEKEEESSKGKEAGWLWWDEPSECNLGTYLMYMSQMCWQLPPCHCSMMRRDRTCPIHVLNNGGFPPFQCILTSNPEAGWVEDRFRDLIEQVEKADEQRKPTHTATDGKRVFVRSLPRDNPYLPPNWESELRVGSTPGIWIDKYLDGKWGTVQGQVFKEFDKATHGIPSLKDIPLDYLKRLKLVGCLDHASTGVTCFRIDGVDPDANIITLASYYQGNADASLSISDHARGIRTLADRIVRLCRPGALDNYSGKIFGQYPAFDFFEYCLIDPSTQAKTQMAGNELWSIQDLYWREGIPVLAAFNAVEAGIDLLLQYIHVTPTHIHPWKLSPDGKVLRGYPRWFVVLDENRDGVREMIGWKIKVNERGEKKYVGADHWIDCGRYIALSRPEPPQFTQRDLSAMDTHSRKAQQALIAFDKKFGAPAQPGQWFPGGGGRAETWFPSKIN